MTEGEFKTGLMNALAYEGYISQRHEDRYENFIPDLSFSGHGVDGWVEIKSCTECPDTLNDLKHWTRGQEEFLRLHGPKGSGHCYLVVGTPDGIWAWRWDSLSHVRNMEWDAAIRHSKIAGQDLVRFASVWSLTVRRRPVR